MIHLEVAVSAPVRQTYTYSVAADESGGGLAPGYIGRRVLIPFGSRPATGYVIDVHEAEAKSFEIKSILKIIDELPLFQPEMVPLFRWVADYYHYPLGLVVKAALPGGLTAAPQKTIHLTGSGSNDLGKKVSEKIFERAWFQKLQETGRLNKRESKAIFSDREDLRDLNSLIKAELVSIENELIQDRVRAKQEICYQLDELLDRCFTDKNSPAFDELCVAAGRELTKAEIKSIRLLKELQEDRPDGSVPRKELTGCYPYGETLLKKMAGEGLVKRKSRRVFRSPYGDLLPHHPRPERLSSEQKAAIDDIVSAIAQKEYAPFLLHGVTGSGKTEVYLQAAENIISKNKNVLVLVPEIALATQIEAHFISRFDDAVALLHSGLSQGERFDEWWRILSGRTRIVIGARSAVFAPLDNIGLIIVDEEHDSSYKQEDGLRYNGRDLALVRGKLENSVVILGSATRAVTSYYHSTTSKYRLLRMDNRIGERKLPDPLLVDMKESAAKNGFKLFHPTLQKGLAETFDSRHQSILLLNRRGFSTSVICRNCGTVVECNHCKVSLNRHRQKNLLLCHYCGFSMAGAVGCQVCGSENLQPVGFGTERVEEEVGVLLPEARIARLDSDVAADRKKFLNILQAMRNREIDVLVGTQIIAKGLHFPHVSLVGVVMADSGLGFPDFRAAEKTFQLITQVTGRAGRGDTKGNVIIQTMQPEHYAIAMAAENRYGDLVEKELAIRESVGFPPFSRLVFIIVEHPNDFTARQSSMEIAAMVRTWCSTHDPDQYLAVLGPAPAPLERLRDRYRWQILVKSKDLKLLHGVTEWIASSYKTKAEARVIIDIDPENML